VLFRLENSELRLAQKGKAHPFIKLRQLNGDELRLFMSLQLVEASLLLHSLTEKESQEFLVIASLCQVFPEALSITISFYAPQLVKYSYPFKSLLDRHLLSADEAPYRNGNSHVNIIRANVLPQCHFCTGFSHANHALQVSNGDWI
jgi:hypothetical protein